MALAERTWERVGERKRDRARLIESAEITCIRLEQLHQSIQYSRNHPGKKKVIKLIGPSKPS